MGMDNLVIYQKMYDLILYSVPIINRFPQSQRFIIGQQIQNSMIDVSKLIVHANKSRNKLPILFEIDLEIEKLRLLIRLAKDLKFMSIKKYENHAMMIDEIGKILGGWIKKSQPSKGHG